MRSTDHRSDEIQSPVRSGLLLLAALPGSAVAALGIDRMSLWWDEADTAALVSRSWGDLIDQLTSSVGSEVSQPLYYLLLRTWVSFAGDSEVALRIPSLVALFLTAFVVGRITLALGAQTRVALVATALYPLLPFSLWYATEARSYALVQLFVATFTLEALRIDRTGHLTRQLAVVTALGVAIIWLWVAVAPAVLLVWLLVAARAASYISTRKLVLVALLSAALASPPAIFTLLSFGDIAQPGGRNPILELVYSLYELVAGRTVGPSVSDLRGGVDSSDIGIHWLGLPVAGLVGLGALIFAIRALTRVPRPQLLMLVAVILWAAAMALIGALGSFPLLGRHISFALPPLAALITLGATGRSRLVPRWTATAMIAATALLALISVAGFWTVDAYKKEDLRAAAILAQDCVPAELFWAANPTAADYYLPDLLPSFVPIDQVSQLPDLPLSGSTVFVLNSSHYDPGGEATAALAARAGNDSRSLPGVYIVAPEDCLTGR
jgi:4-amino-4-deoxy-L-arabinose transferase-like glycosyltransferase